MTCIYISTTFPSNIRDGLENIADALSITVVGMKEADIIIIPSTEAIYVHRQSRDFLNEVAKAVSCDAIIVSHEWLIECGIAFTLLPTDPYDFADDQSHGKSSESVVESSMELVKEHTPQLADEPALELGHCFSEDTDTASSSSSSCSDIIHADTSADLDDPDSEPDVPLRFVCGRRTESQSPQKRVIRDVYDYESSLSPDPEQPKPLPKPKKRPFPFHILMKKRTSQPRADRNRPTVDARDSEAYEMLVELLEERCMKEGFTRVSGKQLCRSLDVEHPHPRGIQWYTVFRRYKGLILKAVPQLKDAVAM